jgi:putrescine transport system substrate-binding protein
VPAQAAGTARAAPVRARGARAAAGALILALAHLSGCGHGTAAPGAPGAPERELHIYNWADYIGQDTIAQFEAATGIKVVYDTYDSD